MDRQGDSYIPRKMLFVLHKINVINKVNMKCHNMEHYEPFHKKHVKLYNVRLGTPAITRYMTV